MKKSAILFCALVATIAFTGCIHGIAESNTHPNSSNVKSIPVSNSEYIFSSYPENSLNTYNSYWDDFAGSIEEGKVYHYSNKGFSPELQFKVLQVIDDKTILITRSSEIGSPYEGARYTKVCESALFLVISNHKYADDAKLRAGDYVANGTYTYETKAKTQKTVYVLVEKSLYDSKNKK